MFLLAVVMLKHAILLRQQAPANTGPRENLHLFLPVLLGRDQVTARGASGYSNRHPIIL
jgi:hypothetical protein